ncbi:MAG: class I SAM-dependent methyltransferase [Paludibacter sp.]|nr:class I SAM-dependent methyltransferase [Paludibacter sp.]
MSEKTNKFHWYDGIFYDKIIAPNQKNLFNQIKEIIPTGSTIIDIGCGTGYLEFLLSDKCKYALGIDLSKRNIEKANKNLSKNTFTGIEFKHTSLAKLNTEITDKSDYAITTYVIHEINENERLSLMLDMAQVAKRIIIGDYLTPQPNNLAGIFSKIIEFVAGREHYRNFKNFQKNGGIHSLIKQGNFRVISEIVNETNHIIEIELIEKK